MKLKELASNSVHDQECNNKSEDKAKSYEPKSDTLENNNQELIDELLAAEKLESELGESGSGFNCSVEIGSSSGNASASATAFPDADEDDEEIILPVTDGDVDPAVLASLPPSMQLDLLVQMRERLMAENRQKYQKVKKAPQKFSELQIEAYLKTVAFRREIDQVQKAASGKGVGGVQTSRIASESNREYIFSSSFSGDKQLLAPGEPQNIPDKQSTAGNKDSSFDIFNFMSFTNKSNKEAGSDVEEDIHTFLDERGLKRVSRRRAMGVRMTRDLERNIDLLKEVEQDRTTASNEPNVQIYSDMEINVGKSPRDGKSFEAVNEYNCDVEDSIANSSLVPDNNKGKSNSEACIKISFDDDGMQSCLDGDDEFFAHLVAGSQAPNVIVDKSTSECDWEDGVLGGVSGSSINLSKLGTHDAQDEFKEDSDVEWEEGSSLIGDKSNTKSYDEENSNSKEIVMEQLIGTCEKASLLSSGVQNVTSKGFVEEEAALQEAIRRSLEDISGKKASKACHIELEAESCSPIPSTQLEIVSDGIQQSQSTNDECGISNSKAGKDSYAPKPFGTHSTAAASTPDGSTPCIATKNHLEQQLGTIIECDETGNLECGSTGLTNMAACISSNTIPKSLNDDMTSVEAVAASVPRKVDEYSVGQTSSALDSSTLHSVLEKTACKNDNFPDSVLERIHEDNTLEPLGSSLEDELLILDQEYINLGDEQRKLERNADSVNAEMFVECQEMLQMFGLPYIIAPMEAEAQCAYMELANLVDGVVTDDSDVFLFGGQSVYKNIFDDRKYVETYLMKDIESELGLNREKLIRMALLLGSDYTEGVSGIGIVNAIEVVNAFPEEDGLRKFREWIESPDPAILDKIGAQKGLNSKKKASKASRKGMIDSKSNMKDYSPAKSDTLLENEDNDVMNDISSIKLAFMNKHRNVSKNWHIPASFPSDVVISAYEAPQVDKSTEPFAWGKPDVFSLRRLCWEKFVWASQKADELLLPVLKEYNKHETQLRLEAFYSFNERFAKIRSKRIQKAVKGITGKQSFDETDDLVENSAKPNTEASSNGNKKKKSPRKRKDNVVEKQNVAKKLKSQQEMGNQEDGLSTEVGSKRVREGRRGKAVGRARLKYSSDFELNETSSSNYSTSDENEHEVLGKNVDFSKTVRRSKRARKAVNYMEKDEESGVIPENSTDLKSSEDVTDEQKSPHSPSAHEIDTVNTCAERELPEQTLSGDYLMTGGGFCAEEEEETESNKLGAIQSDNATLDVSSDYLQMGGGFCLDDEDDVAYQDRDGGEASSPTNTETDEVRQKHDSSEIAIVQASIVGSGLADGIVSSSKLNSSEQHHETTDGTLSNVAHINNDVARNSVNPFSAIPYLKRKRR